MTTDSTSERVLYAGHLPFLEAQLPECVRDFKKSDPLAELWVIVPNQLTRLHLRRVIAKALGTVANVRFMTVTDLMHVIAEPVVMNEGWRTLGESVVDPLLADVIGKNRHKLEYLKPVANSTGFRHAILRTRQELILNEVSPDSLNQVPLRERERASKVRDLILLLNEIQSEFDRLKLHDGASLQELAARAIEELPLRAEPTLLYSLYNLPPLTRTVLAKLISITPVKAFLPWKEDTAAYSFTSILQTWYSEQGFILHGESELTNYKPIRFISAPKASSVATEIIRDILFTDDITAGSAAVLLPSGSEALTSALESRCRTSGLAPYIYQAKTLGQSAAGRGLAALVDLLDDRFSIEQVTAYLLAAPFKKDVAPFAGEWVRLAEESLVLAGRSEWHHRISRKITQLERRATRITENENDEVSEMLATLLQRIENGKSLLEFLSKLFNVVSSVRAEQHWQAATQALWEYYHNEIELDEEFADITLQLEQASLLDQAGVPCTPEGVTHFFRATLETPGTRLGTFGISTPLIAPREQCVGASFDFVFLPGFNEGTIPHLDRQDPLLLDGDRIAINESLKKQLRVTSDSLVRERFQLEMQLRSANKALYVYTARSDADGRPQLVSPYLTELLLKPRCEEKLPADLEDVFASDEHCRIVPAHPLDGAALHAAICESEFNRISLGKALADKSLRALSHLNENSRFTESLKLEHSRFNAKSFSTFDGALNDTNVLRTLSHRFSSDQPLAATALEEYWKCPFRYAVSKQLEAYAPEPLDKLSPVGPRERGLLFHTILQRYHSDRLNLPIAKETYAWSDLERVARLEIVNYARNNPVGPRFSVETLQREILSTLDKYHTKLLEDGATWRTRYVEVSFGYGDNPFPNAAQYIGADGTVIRFKGRVDRWDSDESGTQLVITDYKSGKGPAKHSRGAARRLQLGVYHLFAKAESPDAFIASRYIYLERDNSIVTDDDASRNYALEESVRLLEDIRRGIFVPDPSDTDPSVCMNCSVKLACGAQRHSTKLLNNETVRGMTTTRSVTEDEFDGGDDDE